MTREMIRAYMIERITATIKGEFEDNFDTYIDIDKEQIEDFLWTRDYGLDIARNVLEEKSKDYTERYLEEIYDEIDEYDFEDIELD